MNRNFSKVQYEEIRRKLDEPFNNLHDELTNCYYQFWKKGLSKPFRGYDVQSTIEESKSLFDELHGLIFENYKVAFDNFNIASGGIVPESEYDKLPKMVSTSIVKDEDGEIIDEIPVFSDIQRSLVVESKGLIFNKRSVGIDLQLDIKKIVEIATNGGYIYNKD
ncbi:MAG TPA: hypothetical protein VMW53_07805 [archaeon]|nr:hypothetical protein [archaeon]